METLETYHSFHAEELSQGSLEGLKAQLKNTEFNCEAFIKNTNGRFMPNLLQIFQNQIIIAQF